MLKEVFKPVANRHYTDKKTDRRYAAYSYIPVVMLCIFATIFISKVFFFVLVAILILGVIGYLVIDRVTDKLTWKLFLRRRKYRAQSQHASTNHDVIKQYEDNPSSENLAKLEKQIKRN